MKKILLVLSSITLLNTQFQAQKCNGNLGIPIVNITFGSGGSNPAGALQNVVTGASTTYTYQPNVTNSYPDDGEYSIVNKIPTITASTRWTDFWHINEPDHTPNDINGYMIFYNASYTPGEFYRQTVSSLCPGTTYEFAAFIANVVNKNSTVPSTVYSNVRFSILHPISLAVLATITTDTIYDSTKLIWKRYAQSFTMPPGINSVILTMTNANGGGVGNDIAIDDITFSPCGPLYTISSQSNSFISNKTVCIDDSFTLFGQYKGELNNAGFQWEESIDSGRIWTKCLNGTSINLFVPNIKRDKLFRLFLAELNNINANNCRFISNNVSIKVSVNAPCKSSVYDHMANRYLGLSCSPNPVSTDGDFEFYLLSLSQKTELIITSIDWRILKSVRIDPKVGYNRLKLSLDNIENGLYLYSVVSDGIILDSKKLQIMR